jgi:2-polyprenyl-6-methoxyphenol hydroxylase-like FAD-dependent oxidoreductase
MALGHASGELAPANPQAGRRIVVVGGGVAGLACALACARAGAHVQVLEARRAPARTPAHIDVVPNLLRELALLGVAEPCVRRGFVYSGIAVVDEHGGEAFRLPTERLAGPALPAAAGIALDDLLDVLAAAAQQAGAALHRGCTARAVDADAGCVNADGGAVFEADLVVLATGAESALVRELFGPTAGGTTRHAWWHALLPRPQGLERSTWMAGAPGHRLLLVPIGMERAGVAVACTASADGADGRALVRLLEGWGALPRRIAAAIDPAQPTVLRHAASALREAPWHRGRVLCVGAAAHAVAPHFGQAAAQALEDAVVLGELVGAHTDTATLARRFTERRLPRARRLHALTERAAHWMVRPEPATDLVKLAGEIAVLVAEPA